MLKKGKWSGRVTHAVFSPENPIFEKPSKRCNPMQNRFIILIMILFRVGSLQAQEPAIIIHGGADSLLRIIPEPFESGPVLSGEHLFLPFVPEAMPDVVLPDFDFSHYFRSRWKVDDLSGFGNLPFSGSLFNAGSGFSLFPYPGTGTVFNQASYRLSDKVLIGGNSFGVNTLLSAPFSRPGANAWEWRGASMFMEYKVSRNFRIETRVSVTGNQYPH